MTLHFNYAQKSINTIAVNAYSCSNVHAHNSLKIITVFLANYCKQERKWGALLFINMAMVNMWEEFTAAGYWRRKEAYKWLANSEAHGAQLHSAKQVKPCHAGKQVMLKTEKRLRWFKPQLYIKIGRDEIIQTLLANSMETKLKTTLNLVCQRYPIKFPDVSQRPCYCSALRRGAWSLNILL